MIDREEEMIIEDGDNFRVIWNGGDESLGGTWYSYPRHTKERSFIFQKDKDAFVLRLLKDETVTSIEVGTYITIK